MDDARGVTPLRVWAGVGVVWALLVIGFFAWLHYVDPIHTQDWVKVHQARIDACPTEPRWIVILGRSTLMNATQLPPDMDLGLKEAGLGEYRVLKIGHVGGVYSDFVDLEPSILALRPALVVAEVGLMLTDRPPVARIYYLKRWLKHHLEQNDAIWRPQGETFLLGVDRYLPCPLDKSRNSTTLKYYVQRHNGHLDDRLARSFGGRSSQMALNFVQSLEERGIPLALTYVPKAEGVFGSREELAAQELATLQARHPTPVWVPDWQPDLEDLCDSMHYTAIGRAWYTRWLVGQVKGRLTAGRRP